MNDSLDHTIACHRRIADSEAGYTLIELIVALLITLILGSVLFAVHLATMQWVVPWQREVELENNVHVMAQRLLSDLAHAEQLHAGESAQWILRYRSGREVTYRYEAGRLLRNGHSMHPTTLRVVGFDLVPSRAETRYAPPRRDAAFEDERSLLQVEIHLSVQSQERTLAVVTTTALRQHRPWLPLW